jgi:hypothetical protein
LRNTQSEFKLLPAYGRVENIEIFLLNAGGIARFYWHLNNYPIRLTSFDPKLRNVFIIHGWQAKYESGNWQDVRLTDYFLGL